MKRALLLLTLLPSVSFGTVVPRLNYCTGCPDFYTRFDTNTFVTASSITANNLSPSQGVCTDASANLITSGSSCGAGGGGGTSSLQTTQSGVQITSPTSSLNFTGPPFSLTAVGTTSQINLNPSSVTLLGLPPFPSSDITLISSGVAFGSVTNKLTQDTNTLRWDDTNDLLTLIGSATISGTVNTNTYFEVNGNPFLTDAGATQSVMVGAQVNTQNSGSSNSCLGYNSCHSITNASNNSMFGHQAGALLSSGQHNTCMGHFACNGVTSAQHNTGIGSNALGGSPTGNDNIAIGYLAGDAITSGANNTVISGNGVNNLTSGVFNTIISNGGGVTTGVTNIIIGQGSGVVGDAITTGSSNTIIGGGDTTGSSNGNNQGVTYVGFDADAGVGSQLINATAIGYKAAVNSSNTIQMGGTGLNAVTVNGSTLTFSSGTITNLNLTTLQGVTPGLIAGTNITSITGAWPNQTINAATQGGGGSSTLAVSTGGATSSVIITSPTANVVFDSNTFVGNVVSVSTSVIYVSSAGVLYTSSATATYLQQSSATSVYLQQSSATATYFNKLNQFTATNMPVLTGDVTTPGGSLVTTASALQSNITTFGSSITVNGGGGVTVKFGVNASTFVGNGSGLTSLTGSNITTGIPSTVLPSTIAYTNISNTFTSSQTVTSSVTISGAGGLTTTFGVSANTGTFSSLSSGNCVQAGAGGLLTTVAGACATGGTPGAPTNSIQFNNASAFGGSAGFSEWASSVTNTQSSGIAVNYVVTAGSMIITNPLNSNTTALIINNNDTSSNEDALLINNKGAENALFIDQKNAVSTSFTSGGALLVFNDTSAFGANGMGAGIVVYSPDNAPIDNLVNFRTDNVNFSSQTLFVSAVGLNPMVTFSYQGTSANGAALNVTSTNPNFSAMEVSGQEASTGFGTLKILHSGYADHSDNNSAILSLDMGGAGGTAEQGIFMKSSASTGTIGALVQLRNPNTARFNIDYTGDMGISPSTNAVYALAISTQPNGSPSGAAVVPVGITGGNWIAVSTNIEIVVSGSTGTSGQVLSSQGPGLPVKWTSGGTGDMILAATQTVTGEKIFTSSSSILLNPTTVGDDLVVNSTNALAIFKVNTGSVTAGDFILSIASSPNTGVPVIFGINTYGHTVSSGTTPTVGVCGTTPAMNPNSTDEVGAVVWGGAATVCGFTFANAFQSPPFCLANTAGAAFTEPIGVTASSATFNFSASLTGSTITYHCWGGKGG